MKISNNVYKKKYWNNAVARIYTYTYGHCLKICKMSKYVKHDNTQEYK